LRLASWGVHVFTALGSVCALFSVLAVFDGRYELAFTWLLLALFVDAIDGTMARAVGVEKHLPRFSGERLDLVIDFVTYVFVPVVALMRGGFLVGGWGHLTAAIILLSALYHFADNDSKSGDHCFVGFPAVWNLVAFCIFAWDLPIWSATLLCLALSVLAFVPMHWIHPMRVARFFRLNVAMAASGMAASCWILATGFPAGPVAATVLAVTSIYFLAMATAWSFLRTDAGQP